MLFINLNFNFNQGVTLINIINTVLFVLSITLTIIEEFFTCSPLSHDREGKFAPLRGFSLVNK